MPASRKSRFSHTYVPYTFSNPTTWSYRPLLAEAREHIKVGDIVRVCLVFRSSDYWIKRYVRVTEIHGKHLLGVVDDPYNGTPDAGCDGCNRYFSAKEKGIKTCHACSFHLCSKCLKQKTHEHTLVDYNNHTDFCNETVISFKQNAIMEIPNWTTNTARICEKFLAADIESKLFGNLPI